MSRALTVFFRFDDYSETSPAAVETGLVDALRRNRCIATFGVIPAVTEGSYHEPGERGTHPLGREKTRFLLQAVNDGAVDVALHGFDHRTRARSAPHSEFVGLNAALQVERVQKGQDFLRRLLSIEPTVFIPPWNRYDEHTLEALVQQQLAAVSANRFGPTHDGPLRFIPITANILEMRPAIAVARESDDADAIVGVLIHPYDFNESGDSRAVMSCNEFGEELKWLVSQSDIRVASVSQLAAHNRTLDAARYRANAPSPIDSLFPPFVQTTQESIVYRSTSPAAQTKRRNVIATVATHLGIGLLAALVVTLLYAWLDPAPGIVPLATTLAVGLLVALLVRARRQGTLRFRSAILGALATGAMVAGLVRWTQTL